MALGKTVVSVVMVGSDTVRLSCLVVVAVEVEVPVEVEVAVARAVRAVRAAWAARAVVVAPVREERSSS